MKTFLSKIFGLDSDKPSEVSDLADEESNNESGAWIGVDLDGTLAQYHGWRGNNHVGKPVPAMLARVHDWMEQGYTVKIFTARASVPELIPPIEKWLKKHGLEGLEITNCKDMDMIELWDDRSVQVIMNTGNPVRSPSFMSRPRVPLIEEKMPQEAETELSFPPRQPILEKVS